MFCGTYMSGQQSVELLVEERHLDVGHCGHILVQLLVEFPLRVVGGRR